VKEKIKNLSLHFLDLDFTKKKVFVLVKFFGWVNQKKNPSPRV